MINVASAHIWSHSAKLPLWSMNPENKFILGFYFIICLNNNKPLNSKSLSNLAFGGLPF